MSKNTKKKRTYNRITPAHKAAFKAAEVINGNGSAAVRELTPEAKNPGDRAYRIRKLSDDTTPELYIDTQLQQIGMDAIDKLGQLVNSNDERVAGVNSRYVVDQVIGQATKKSVVLTGKLNIQDVIR